MGTAAGLLVDVPWSCCLVLGGYCGAAVWPNSHARLLPLCNIISDKSKITQPLHHSPSLQQLLVLPASSRHPVSSILQLLTIVTDLAHQHHPRRCLLRKSSKNAVFFLCINKGWVLKFLFFVFGNIFIKSSPNLKSKVSFEKYSFSVLSFSIMPLLLIFGQVKAEI